MTDQSEPAESEAQQQQDRSETPCYLSAYFALLDVNKGLGSPVSTTGRVSKANILPTRMIGGFMLGRSPAFRSVS